MSHASIVCAHCAAAPCVCRPGWGSAIAPGGDMPSVHIGPYTWSTSALPVLPTQPAVNPCTDPDCPCLALPSLAGLYTLRATMGLLVQTGHVLLEEYAQLCAKVAAHEAAREKAGASQIPA